MGVGGDTDTFCFRRRGPSSSQAGAYTRMRAQTLLVLAWLKNGLNLCSTHAHLLSLETMSRKADLHLRAHHWGHLFIPASHKKPGSNRPAISLPLALGPDPPQVL